MASTINAITTGVGGVVTSGDASGVLALQTGGTTAVTVSAAQVVSLLNALPVASGGTGVIASGANGNVLTSNGTTWASTALVIPIAFPAGTRMSFQQTAAPTGWTKDTTAAINDSALRFVTGSVVNGGSVAFSTAFASQAVSGTNGASGATTLSTAQIPSHQHSVIAANAVTVQAQFSSAASAVNTAGNTGLTGGGGSHTHPAASFTGTAINLAVKYYDFIIASKD